ncbi:hypothetical protein PLACP1_33210 [Planifilum fimeticola]
MVKNILSKEYHESADQTRENMIFIHTKDCLFLMTTRHDRGNTWDLSRNTRGVSASSKNA